MLVLDENLPEGQRLWLRKWRIHFPVSAWAQWPVSTPMAFCIGGWLRILQKQLRGGTNERA